MPTRLCIDRCGQPATYRGRCPTCATARERATHHNKHVYNSAKWKRTRERVLTEQPLCTCGAIATGVDHITAIEDGGNPWARHNLQGLCGPCHATKTNREVRSR
jgi:5-methylcytosine-specific restriction endonuclease McrA